MKPEELLEGLSPKAQAFVREMADLCEKHGFQLATSGYDGIDLWPLKPGDDPIYCAGIEEVKR